MQPNQLLEMRLENSSGGSPLYIGLTPNANALTSDPVWYVLKLGYDVNGFLDYQQLPDNGRGFTYIWDSRATYF